MQFVLYLICISLHLFSCFGCIKLDNIYFVTFIYKTIKNITREDFSCIYTQIGEKGSGSIPNFVLHTIKGVIDQGKSWSKCKQVIAWGIYQHSFLFVKNLFTNFAEVSFKELDFYIHIRRQKTRPISTFQRFTNSNKSHISYKEYKVNKCFIKNICATLRLRIPASENLVL